MRAFPVIFLFLFSCNPKKIYEQTALEKQFIDSLSIALRATIELEKSYNVEYKEHNDETIYLILNYNDFKYNSCLEDSLRLQLIAQRIASEFNKVMDKAWRYKNIGIKFYSSDLSVSRMETPTCDRTFFYNRKNNQFIEYLESNRDIRLSEKMKKFK